MAMDAEGNKLPDGTKVTYEIKAWLDDGDDEVDDSFSFQVTLDNEKPQIVNAYDLQDSLRIENGKILLSLTLQDNQNLAAVIFVNPDGIIMGKYEVDNVPGQPTLPSMTSLALAPISPLCWRTMPATRPSLMRCWTWASTLIWRLL